MIVVKFLGGAKKSFNSDQLKIDESNVPIFSMDIYGKDVYPFPYPFPTPPVAQPPI